MEPDDSYLPNMKVDVIITNKTMIVITNMLLVSLST